jgi:hypothetical protein
MTPAKQAILDGFAETLANHGQTWTRTSDSSPVYGVAGTLKRNDPRLKGTQDMVFPILVAPANMPNTRLAQGQELTKDSKYFRVNRVDIDEASGLWEVLVTATF